MLRLKNISGQLVQQDKQFTYSVGFGHKKQGETQPRRHPRATNGLLHVNHQYQNLGVLWDQLVNKFYDHKIVQDIKFNELDRYVNALGSYLLANHHQKVYIYSKNCAQWTITDLASWTYGAVTIPLYDTLGPEAFHHIVRLTEGSAILTESAMCKNLLKYLRIQKVTIKEMIVYDKISEQDRKAFEEMDIIVTLFSHIMDHNLILKKPKLNLQSHLTYSFTSGTTGLPKGVICTQRNALSQLLAMIGFINYLPTDVHMSYLPIAHIFQRYVIWMCIFYGCNIQYSKHPAGEILKDLGKIRPTCIPIVPRLLNKLYPIMKKIYEKENSTSSIKLLFGGRLRTMITASAPVSAEILKFFKEVLQCEVREAYGQTETTALSFVTNPYDTNYGHVGGPNTSFQMKLVDVPQMNYTTDTFPPRGQICLRGDSIFVGYYKDQINTSQTLDSQGWSHTGDIGMFLPNGALKIIDRKKNIYKLSQGEYVAPQKVQNIYLRCKYVAQSFVYGDSMKDYNIAIIHPNLENIQQVCQIIGIKQKQIDKICSMKAVKEFIFARMNQQAKKDGLFGFETAKKIKLWPISFNNYGIFTSTMKLQRHIAKKTFNEEINKLYSE